MDGRLEVEPRCARLLGPEPESDYDGQALRRRDCRATVSLSFKRNSTVSSARLSGLYQSNHFGLGIDQGQEALLHKYIRKWGSQGPEK